MISVENKEEEFFDSAIWGFVGVESRGVGSELRALDHRFLFAHAFRDMQPMVVGFGFRSCDLRRCIPKSEPPDRSVVLFGASSNSLSGVIWGWRFP